ncbi:MAG: hypothetical protein U1E97_05140 [Alphaproteobacteria bacterium]
MKKIIIISTLTTVFAAFSDPNGWPGAAQAQVQAQAQPQGRAPAAVTRAAPIIVQITDEDCARLVVHRPEPGATYQPGVDAYGQAVPPAEGSGAQRPLRLPESYAVEITVDLQRRFNLPPNATLYAGEAKLGYVTVTPDGSAYFNGEPILDEEQALLSALCQERRPARR